MELNVHDMPNNSFQFFLWAIKDKEAAIVTSTNQNFGNIEDSHIYIDHKLVGECYMSLYKIYIEEEV